MIRVLGDRVLVALPPKEHQQDAATGYTYQAGETTASGLIVAKPPDVYNVELATRGIVMQVGEKSGTVDLDEVFALITEEGERSNPDFDDRHLVEALRTLEPAAFDVQVGDCVLFPATAGDQIIDGGVNYCILHEDDILAVVDPLTKEDEAAA